LTADEFTRHSGGGAGYGDWGGHGDTIFYGVSCVKENGRRTCILLPFLKLH
jgi:hypothetical protein